MRKNLIIIFTFLSMMLSAQADTFNYILTFKSERLEPKNAGDKNSKVQVAINNFDSSYYMYIYGDKTARLFDYKNLYVHHFNIKKKKDNILSNLKKKKSVKLASSEQRFYSAKKINENEYLLQVFDSAEMKISTTDITIKLIESPVEIIFIDADIGNHSINLAEKLKEILEPEKKFRVQSMKVDYKNGNIFLKTLTDFEELKYLTSFHV